MPVTVQEKFGRVLSDQSAELTYVVRGTEDDGEARSAALSASPTSHQGLARDDTEVEEVSPGIWLALVRYASSGSTLPGAGQSSFAFETRGGTQHITQSLQTVGSYASGDIPAAPDFRGGIGVTESGVEGTDITVPVYTFSETHYFPPEDVNSAYKATLFGLTGRVNNGSFKGLGIHEPIILPGDHLDEYLRQTAVKVVVPTDEEHLGRLVVLVAPLPAGSIGRAYSGGVCPAQVDVVDAAHTTAGIVPGDSSRLQSGKPGVDVVWVPPGSTGTVWGLIRLGGPIGFWAEITSGDPEEAAEGPFDWKMLQVDASGGGAFSDVSPAVTGTANAYEANEAAVPAETRVWLTLAGRSVNIDVFVADAVANDGPTSFHYADDVRGQFQVLIDHRVGVGHGAFNLRDIGVFEDFQIDVCRVGPFLFLLDRGKSTVGDDDQGATAHGAVTKVWRC